MKATKTPYNTIYQQILLDNNKKSKANAVTCCVHGSKCSHGEKESMISTSSTTNEEKTDESYENIMSPSREEKMATQLSTQLSKLAKSERVKHKAEAEFVSLESVVSATRNSENDQQSYAVVDNKKRTRTRRSAKQPKSETVTSEKSSVVSEKKVPASDALSYYIGVRTPSDAESQLRRSTDFALYHQLPNHEGTLNNITDQLSLCLVYRNSNNFFRHFPIRSDSSNGDVQYFVDYGKPNVRKHWSLDQLVRYYKNHVTFDMQKGTAEVFSDWE